MSSPYQGILFINEYTGDKGMCDSCEAADHFCANGSYEGGKTDYIELYNNGGCVGAGLHEEDPLHCLVDGSINLGTDTLSSFILENNDSEFEINNDGEASNSQYGSAIIAPGQILFLCADNASGDGSGLNINWNIGKSGGDTLTLYDWEANTVDSVNTISHDDESVGRECNGGDTWSKMTPSPGQSNGVCSDCTSICPDNGAPCGLDPICGTDDCGSCEEGFTCIDNYCEEDCVPNCTGDCGDDGCGGICGTCSEGQFCDNGSCVSYDISTDTVIISEIHPRGSEWIEIYNYGVQPVDLTGYRILSVNGREGDHENEKWINFEICSTDLNGCNGACSIGPGETLVIFERTLEHAQAYHNCTSDNSQIDFSEVTCYQEGFNGVNSSANDPNHIYCNGSCTCLTETPQDIGEDCDDVGYDSGSPDCGHINGDFDTIGLFKGDPTTVSSNPQYYNTKYIDNELWTSFLGGGEDVWESNGIYLIHYVSFPDNGNWSGDHTSSYQLTDLYDCPGTCVETWDTFSQLERTPGYQYWEDIVEDPYKILISEISYNPAQTGDGSYTDDDWVKVCNIGPDSIDLHNWTLTDDDHENNRCTVVDSVILNQDECFVFYETEKNNTACYSVPETLEIKEIDPKGDHTEVTFNTLHGLSVGDTITLIAAGSDLDYDEGEYHFGETFYVRDDGDYQAFGDMINIGKDASTSFTVDDWKGDEDPWVRSDYSGEDDEPWYNVDNSGNSSVGDSACYNCLIHDSVTKYIDECGFGLGGGGDEIRLYNVDPLDIGEFNYYSKVVYDDAPPWPTEPDGEGHTLQLISDSLTTSQINSAIYWQASVGVCTDIEPVNGGISPHTTNPQWEVPLIFGCTDPSATNYEPAATFNDDSCEYPPGQEPAYKILISEINYNNDECTAVPEEDWIKICNVGTESKNISGWRFMDSEERNCYIPDGINLGPQACYTLYLENNGPYDYFVHDCVTNFYMPADGSDGCDMGLSGGGELIRLFTNEDQLYNSVTFSDDWGGDGNCHTLQLQTIDVSYNPDGGSSYNDGVDEIPYYDSTDVLLWRESDYGFDEISDTFSCNDIPNGAPFPHKLHLELFTVPGCTYEEAINFNPYATDNDGSCEFNYCSDLNAINYNELCEVGYCISECIYPPSSLSVITITGSYRIIDVNGTISSISIISDVLSVSYKNRFYTSVMGQNDPTTDEGNKFSLTFEVQDIDNFSRIGFRLMSVINENYVTMRQFLVSETTSFLNGIMDVGVIDFIYDESESIEGCTDQLASNYVSQGICASYGDTCLYEDTGCTDEMACTCDNPLCTNLCQYCGTEEEFLCSTNSYGFYNEYIKFGCGDCCQYPINPITIEFSGNTSINFDSFNWNTDPFVHINIDILDSHPVIEFSFNIEKIVFDESYINNGGAESLELQIKNNKDSTSTIRGKFSEPFYGNITLELKFLDIITLHSCIHDIIFYKLLPNNNRYPYESYNLFTNQYCVEVYGEDVIDQLDNLRDMGNKNYTHKFNLHRGVNVISFYSLPDGGEGGIEPGEIFSHESFFEKISDGNGYIYIEDPYNPMWKNSDDSFIGDIGEPTEHGIFNNAIYPAVGYSVSVCVDNHLDMYGDPVKDSPCFDGSVQCDTVSDPQNPTCIGGYWDNKGCIGIDRWCPGYLKNEFEFEVIQHSILSADFPYIMDGKFNRQYFPFVDSVLQYADGDPITRVNSGILPQCKEDIYTPVSTILSFEDIPPYSEDGYGVIPNDIKILEHETELITQTDIDNDGEYDTWLGTLTNLLPGEGYLIKLDPYMEEWELNDKFIFYLNSYYDSCGICSGSPSTHVANSNIDDLGNCCLYPNKIVNFYVRPELDGDPIYEPEVGKIFASRKRLCNNNVDGIEIDNLNYYRISVNNCQGYQDCLGVCHEDIETWDDTVNYSKFAVIDKYGNCCLRGNIDECGLCDGSSDSCESPCLGLAGQNTINITSIIQNGDSVPGEENHGTIQIDITLGQNITELDFQLSDSLQLGNAVNLTQGDISTDEYGDFSLYLGIEDTSRIVLFSHTEGQFIPQGVSFSLFLSFDNIYTDEICINNLNGIEFSVDRQVDFIIGDCILVGDEGFDTFYGPYGCDDIMAVNYNPSCSTNVCLDGNRTTCETLGYTNECPPYDATVECILNPTDCIFLECDYGGAAKDCFGADCNCAECNHTCGNSWLNTCDTCILYINGTCTGPGDECASAGRDCSGYCCLDGGGCGSVSYGQCDGGENHTSSCSSDVDCPGICYTNGGSAALDSCGDCAGGNTGAIPNANYGCQPEISWCDGSVLDVCGVCNGDGQFEYYFDGDGDGLGCDGTNVLLCPTLSAELISNTYYGNLPSGNCSGSGCYVAGPGDGGESLELSPENCNCVDNLFDVCNICGGEGLGTVDIIENGADCPNGASDSGLTCNCEGDSCDVCGICGGTGKINYWIDDDGDGFGCADSEPSQWCPEGTPGYISDPPAENYVPNNLDPSELCDCDADFKDFCGVCGGDNSTLMCDGTCGGTAYFDDCGICSCPGGEIVENECQVPHVPNSDIDCNGDCLGSAITDDCGECSLGLTGSQNDCTINGDDDCPVGGNEVCNASTNTCHYKYNYSCSTCVDTDAINCNPNCVQCGCADGCLDLCVADGSCEYEGWVDFPEIPISENLYNMVGYTLENTLAATTAFPISFDNEWQDGDKIQGPWCTDVMVNNDHCTEEQLGDIITLTYNNYWFDGETSLLNLIVGRGYRFYSQSGGILDWLAFDGTQHQIGCMDSTAIVHNHLNYGVGIYNPDANVPGPCLYCDSEGMDSANCATEGLEDAQYYYNCISGVCSYTQPTVGCMDTTAANYNSNVQIACDSANQDQYQVADINEDFELADIFGIGSCDAEVLEEASDDNCCCLYPNDVFDIFYCDDDTISSTTETVSVESYSVTVQYFPDNGENHSYDGNGKIHPWWITDGNGDTIFKHGGFGGGIVEAGSNDEGEWYRDSYCYWSGNYCWDDNDDPITDYEQLHEYTVDLPIGDYIFHFRDNYNTGGMEQGTYFKLLVEDEHYQECIAIGQIVSTGGSESIACDDNPNCTFYTEGSSGSVGSCFNNNSFLMDGGQDGTWFYKTHSFTIVQEYDDVTVDAFNLNYNPNPYDTMNSITNASIPDMYAFYPRVDCMHTSDTSYSMVGGTNKLNHDLNFVEQLAILNNINYTDRNELLTKFNLSADKWVGTPKKIKTLNLDAIELELYQCNNYVYKGYDVCFDECENIGNGTCTLKLINKIPYSIGALTEVTDLNLSNNDILYLPESISNLNKIGNLRIINTAIGTLNGDIFPSEWDMSQIIIIYLENMGLTEVPGTLLNENSKIETLSLSDNNITVLPWEVINWKKLRELYLRNNNLTGLISEFYLISEFVINDETIVNNETCGNNDLCYELMDDSNDEFGWYCYAGGCIHGIQKLDLSGNNQLSSIDIPEMENLATPILYLNNMNYDHIPYIPRSIYELHMDDNNLSSGLVENNLSKKQNYHCVDGTYNWKSYELIGDCESECLTSGGSSCAPIDWVSSILSIDVPYGTPYTYPAYGLRYISMSNNNFELIPNDIWNTKLLWGLYLSNNNLIDNGNDQFDSFFVESQWGNNYMFAILDISNNQFQFVPDTFRVQAEEYLGGWMFPGLGNVVLNIEGNQMYCNDDIPPWLDEWNNSEDIDLIGYPGNQSCP